MAKRLRMRVIGRESEGPSRALQDEFCFQGMAISSGASGGCDLWAQPSHPRQTGMAMPFCSIKNHKP